MLKHFQFHFLDDSKVVNTVVTWLLTLLHGIVVDIAVTWLSHGG